MEVSNWTGSNIIVRAFARKSVVTMVCLLPLVTARSGWLGKVVGKAATDHCRLPLGLLDGPALPGSEGPGWNQWSAWSLTSGQ